MRTIQIFDLLFHRVELIYYYMENSLIFFVNYSFQYIYILDIYLNLYIINSITPNHSSRYIYISLFFFLKIKYLLIAVLSINLLSKSY